MSAADPHYVFMRAPSGRPAAPEMAPQLLKQLLGVRAPDGRSPLMFAAERENIKPATRLLDKGADIDDQAHDGRTSLAFAAEGGHARMVKFLMESGASIWLATSKGDTPFSLAARAGHLEVVRTLLAEIPVLTACRHPQLERQLMDETYPLAVRELLSEARSSELSLINAAMSKGPGALQQVITGKDTVWLNSALLTVAALGLEKAVEPLIKAGADVNERTLQGQTALLVASELGHVEVTKKLLQNGASVMVRTRMNHGPLSLAVLGNHHQVLHALLARPAGQYVWFVEQAGEQSFSHNETVTALHVAAKQGNLEALYMLFNGLNASTYSPTQLERAKALARTAGQTEAVVLLDRLMRVDTLTRALFNQYQFVDLDPLFAEIDGVNAALQKTGLNPLRAFLEHAVSRPQSHHPNSKLYDQVGMLLLHAGVDSTVKTRAGESMLTLAVKLKALHLASFLVSSGQCDDRAEPDLLSSLLTPSWGLNGGRVMAPSDLPLNLLDWLVFSGPVSERDPYLQFFQSRGLWPKDLNNVSQRNAALRAASLNGCVGIVRTLLTESSDAKFVNQLMYQATTTGSWNVVKALQKDGWVDAIDKGVMQNALTEALKNRDHGALVDILMLNDLLPNKSRKPARGAVLEAQALPQEDIGSMFTRVEYTGDIAQLNRLIRSGACPPRGELTSREWLIGRELLADHRAWAAFDFVWCAEGVGEQEKRILTSHGLWPRNEQDGQQVAAAISAIARVGGSNIFGQLLELPALKKWRDLPENAASYDAMMARSLMVLADTQSINAFELIQSKIQDD
ncbi:ankyrin repeat domain-containing protein [Ottowia thiooxydans]